ncbi:DUF6105 family protein [Aureimonas leprariae]|uniref:Uncharacterized protein n=1 Tax=Plantimonas leprariae TaxID=2615207 RepID=A0A7V7PS34_9HYPH|nr:DUF6105 family protein [Aureimonas leprariae]KAB0681837.1 hypothetical protein F6X38_03165 [Aureimonas leprariae]
MRLFLVLWLAPGTLFWSWHLLSLHDVVFPRAFHDEVFRIYGALLNVEPSEIPGLFAHAFATDSLLVLTVLAFRRRKAIALVIRRFLAHLRHRGWLQGDRAPLGG